MGENQPCQHTVVDGLDLSQFLRLGDRLHALVALQELLGLSPLLRIRSFIKQHDESLQFAVVGLNKVLLFLEGCGENRLFFAGLHIQGIGTIFLKRVNLESITNWLPSLQKFRLHRFLTDQIGQGVRGSSFGKSSVQFLSSAFIHELFRSHDVVADHHILFVVVEIVLGFAKPKSFVLDSPRQQDLWLRLMSPKRSCQRDVVG